MPFPHLSDTEEGISKSIFPTYSRPVALRKALKYLIQNLWYKQMWFDSTPLLQRSLFLRLIKLFQGHVKGSTHMQYLLMTSPALHIVCSSSPSHQKLSFPLSLSVFPFCGDLQWILQCLGCLPLHTQNILQHFRPRASSGSPSNTHGISSLVEPPHAQLKESTFAFPQTSSLLPSSTQNSNYTPDPVLIARAPRCKGSKGFILLNIVKQWEPLDGMYSLWAGGEGSTWLSSTTFLCLIFSCINTNIHLHIYFFSGQLILYSPY